MRLFVRIPHVFIYTRKQHRTQHQRNNNKNNINL